MVKSERPTATVKVIPVAAAPSASSTGAAEPDLAALEAYDLPDLRATWRRLHRGVQPPSLSRDLLLRDIAFRLQEIAFGSLRPAAKRKLAVLSMRSEQRIGAASGAGEIGPEDAGAGIGAGNFPGDENTDRPHEAAAPTLEMPGGQRRERKAARTVSIQLKPGATLMRSWHGKTHTVQVTSEGYEYDGQKFGSLSLIAQQITDSHWSGPRFFGLVQRVQSKPNVHAVPKIQTSRTQTSRLPRAPGGPDHA